MGQRPEKDTVQMMSVLYFYNIQRVQMRCCMFKQTPHRITLTLCTFAFLVCFSLKRGQMCLIIFHHKILDTHYALCNTYTFHIHDHSSLTFRSYIEKFSWNIAVLIDNIWFAQLHNRYFTSNRITVLAVLLWASYKISGLIIQHDTVYIQNALAASECNKP